MFNYCLSAEAVATGWTLCLQNAGGLVRAAERLLQADHVPPALSLAILAQEELGKALLVADAAVLSADNDHGWRHFQGRFRSHETKQEVYGRLFIRRSIVLFLRAWLRNIPITEVRVEVPPDSIKFHYDMYRFSESAIKLKLDSRLAQFDELKQRGFYVHLEGKHFTGPEEIPRPLVEPYVGATRYGLREAEQITEKNAKELAAAISEIREHRGRDPELASRTVQEMSLEMDREVARSLRECGWPVEVKEILASENFEFMRFTDFVTVFGMACAK